MSPSGNISINISVQTAQAQQGINQVNQSLAQTGTTAQKSSTQASTGINTVTSSVGGLNQALAGLGRNVSAALGGLNNQANTLARSFSSLSSALAGLGLERFGMWLINTASDLDRIRKAMVQYTGSVEEAGQVWDKVAQIARASPFPFKELENAARNMMAFGIATKDIPPDLKVMVDAAAASGRGIEGLNVMIQTFGRIVNKEFVNAFDLFRQLPRQGIEAMKALQTELSKERGGAPVTPQDVMEAIRNNVLNPVQVMQTVLASAEFRVTDFAKKLQDPAAGFKNLRDSIIQAAGELGGPQGFGPALVHLSEELEGLLTLVGGFAKKLEELPESTKELIVNIAAAAVAITALSTALSLMSNIIGPLQTGIKTLGQLLLIAFANPELLAAIAGITAALILVYKLVPGVQEKVDQFAGGVWDKLIGKLKELQAAGKKAMDEIIGRPEATGPLGQETVTNVEKLTEKYRQLATQAGETMFKAMASPIDAINLKYNQLFIKLNEDFVKFGITTQESQDKLTAILEGARQTELAGAYYQKKKQDLEEYQKFETEKVKGAADAQIAYIEAQDHQDLRRKIQDIDQIANIRIRAAEDVAKVEKNRAQQQYDAYKDLIDAHSDDLKALGMTQDQINESVSEAHRQMTNQQALADQKAFDESQKYRLEGWKKANDAIIEDQKRIYTSFRDIFDQIFDVFTGKAQTMGKEMGALFKKLALGEAKEVFSSQLAALGTQAAGYGRPEEALRPQGLLGILLRRGMPPRAAMPPPPPYTPVTSNEKLNYLTESGQDIKEGGNKILIAAGVIDAASQRMLANAEPANEAPLPTTMPSGPPGGSAWGRFNQYITTPSTAGAAPSSDVLAQLDQASARYSLPAGLLRSVARVESSYRPGAVSSEGAQGLLQLMPGTARDLGVTDPFDVGQSAEGGARYLRQQLDRFGGNIPMALAAYNAGFGRVERLGGIPSTGETLPYIGRVMAGLPVAPIPSPIPTSLEAEGGPGAVGAALGGGEALTVMPPPAEPFATAKGAGLGSLFGGLAGSFLGGGGGGGGFSLGGLLGGSSAPVIGGGGGSSVDILNQIYGPVGGPPNPALHQMMSLFGIGQFGAKTSFGSVATSQGMGGIYSMLGMLMASRGLQAHVPGIATMGGGLAGAGMVLSNPKLMSNIFKSLGHGAGGMAAGLGAGIATGAGLSLFASGFQRGGGAGLGMDIGGGALAGAGIGTMIAPGIGTAIGAAVGAAAGAITGVVRLFVKTEQERIRSTIKQVYGIDISNRSILSQIQQIVDQQYGGSVSVGVRSQEVQNLVRLYALSTGQAANMPRQMYNATYIQSQAGGMALQNVYQGGQLVQNPYTGPTTYQYQTAVTQAQSLMAGTSQGVPGASDLKGSLFMQLNAQQAQQLMTGQVVNAIQSNPAAVATASAAAAKAGDSRMTTAAAMMEPLTALS